MEAACKECWQCKENRIHDWVGRTIAENEDAVGANSYSLTYGPDANGNKDHFRSLILNYHDVQVYLKRLRTGVPDKDGNIITYPVRYFVAGEYGSQKERAHWHVLAFWQERIPPHELYEEQCWLHLPYWQWGHTYWQPFDEKSARYAAKYILKKEDDPNSQNEYHMSKYPPLGYRFFQRLAMKYVNEGIAPHKAVYSFAEVRDKETGLPREFYMSAAVRDLFCKTFVECWTARYGDHVPQSELLDDYENRVAWKKYVPGTTPYAKRDKYEVRSKPPNTPGVKPGLAPNGGTIRFDQKLNAFYALDAAHGRLWWSFDLQGLPAWQSVLRTETEAKRIREDYERRRDPARYRAASKGG